MSDGVGWNITGEKVHVLVFADDMIVLSDSPEVLPRNLNIVNEYIRMWRFDINLGVDKTEIMMIGGKMCKCGSLVESNWQSRSYAKFWIDVILINYKL